MMFTEENTVIAADSKKTECGDRFWTKSLVRAKLDATNISFTENPALPIQDRCEDKSF
jgi:hypothetical protein